MLRQGSCWQHMPSSQQATLDAWLKLRPQGVRSVLITRHSVRDLTDAHGNSGYDIPLNAHGRVLAAHYGSWLSERLGFEQVLSSPVGRCLDTARLMSAIEPEAVEWLKEPGAFVDKNPVLAARFFRRLVLGC